MSVFANKHDYPASPKRGAKPIILVLTIAVMKPSIPCVIGLSLYTQ